MAEKVAHVESIAVIAPEVLELHLRAVDPVALVYKPGQFVSVRVDASGSLRRSYSIASHPRLEAGARLELLVKLVEGGVGSRFFAGLRVGDPVCFTGPLGFFVPDAHHAGDAVFAVTGAGIAAALPMIDEILSRADERGRVRLFWGLRHERDLYWMERLAHLAGAPGARGRLERHVSLSAPSPAWRGLAGRITGHVLATADATSIYYVVGNGDMIRDVRDGLVAAGVDRKKQIRTEVFYPAARPAQPAATP
jgi:CDP-4-dehydro-6-deoxyglucose reductase